MKSNFMIADRLRDGHALEGSSIVFSTKVDPS
jgi:hypothetical protein